MNTLAFYLNGQYLEMKDVSDEELKNIMDWLEDNKRQIHRFNSTGASYLLFKNQIQYMIVR
jgi:hypothetical protein